MFTIDPNFAGGRIPGQVPRLDRDLDRMFVMPPQIDYEAQLLEPARPIMRAENTAQDLGLPQHVADDIGRIVKHDAAGATNELDFRRGVMTTLLERRYAPDLRRAIMARAISFFRNTTRSSTSSWVPTFTVRPSELPNLRPDSGQVGPTRGAPQGVRKAAFVIPLSKAGEALPSTTSNAYSGPAAGGGHASAARLPPGSKRMWHNRIVQKMQDDKWHVVGHVAGLEPQQKQHIQPLAHHEIPPAELQKLIELMRRLDAKAGKKEHAELQEKPAQTAPADPTVRSAATDAPAPKGPLGGPSQYAPKFAPPATTDERTAPPQRTHARR